MKLANKKAIITGANRSIGKAIAIAFAQAGADIVISYRSDKKGAEDTVAKIQEMGGSATAFYADFSEIKEIKSFFQSALDTLGSIDILVNNAGGYDVNPFLDLTVNQFEHLFKVGPAASMLLTQLVAKEMIKHRCRGSILNISSTSGNRPYPNRVAHSSAKAALNMLTQSTALELAPHGIRVNALAPGPTPYEATNDQENPFDIPLGRSGKPEDQAQAALFLASEDASWMTGQVLTIDGGQSLSFEKIQK